MSEIITEILIPLDDEQYLRRECPFCKEQLKIKLSEVERTKLIQDLLDSYLKETPNDEVEETIDEMLYHCPYCGQQATPDGWWTTEQINYLMIFAKNIANKKINKTLIEGMEKICRGNSFLKFEGKKLKYEDPWISPEENDMTIYELPCCNESIKLKDDFKEREYFCFFCGFKHRTK